MTKHLHPERASTSQNRQHDLHDQLGADPHACKGHCHPDHTKEPDQNDQTRPHRTFPVPACPPAKQHHCRIAGIILAAGRASRMGRCKAVLPLTPPTDTETHTPLQTTLHALQGGCNGPVLVVTGFHDAEVRSAATRLGMATVHNPDAHAGMFSSVCTGLETLFSDTTTPDVRSEPLATQGQPLKNTMPDGVFVLPVDIPLVRPATCAILAEDFALHKAAVTYPVFAGERGHPPLLRADVARQALDFTGEGGLRAVLEAAEMAGLPVRDVETADAAMLMDMDTPQGYETVMRQWAMRHIPTELEIRQLLHMAQTPAHVQAHGVCVAQAAVCLGQHINTRRDASAGATQPPLHELDLALIHAAGCLHDICKGAQHHEQAGGVYLARYGFEQVGAIVAAHKDIDPATVSAITERELVMLADKFVRGTALVTVAERFDERLHDWAHHAQAVADIGGRKARALALCAMLEHELGTDAHALLKREGICQPS